MDNLKSIKMLIEHEKLIGVMSDCKWDAIYKLFQDRSLHFLYRSKEIDGSVFPEGHLRFDIREVFPIYHASLLWVEVHSIEKVEIGKLVAPKIIDNTAAAINLAEKAKARFTLTEYGLKIWGYVKQGENVDFYKSVNA